MPRRLQVGVVIASTREGRLADRVVGFVRKAVEKQHDVLIFDPLECDLPLTQQSVNFLMGATDAIPDSVKQLERRFAKCDAIILVSAEYNWCIPPGITNLLGNVPPTTMCWKPCAIVTYSISEYGGAAVASQLRTFTGCLGMLAVPKQISIARAHERLDENGATEEQRLNEQLRVMLEHLYWAANALKEHSTKNPPPAWVL